MLRRSNRARPAPLGAVMIARPRHAGANHSMMAASAGLRRALSNR